MLYGKYGKGMVFFNEGETQFASIVIKSRGNLAADQISQLVNEVEARILDVRGLKSLNTWTTDSGDTRRGLDRIGQMFVEVVGENERDRPSSAILEEIRTRTASLAGVLGRSEGDGARAARRQADRARVPIARSQAARTGSDARARIHGYAGTAACATSTTRVRCRASSGNSRSIAPKRRCLAPTCRRSGWRCSSSPMD